MNPKTSEETDQIIEPLNDALYRILSGYGPIWDFSAENFIKQLAAAGYRIVPALTQAEIDAIYQRLKELK